MRFKSRLALLALAVLPAFPAAAQDGATPIVIRADRLIIGTDAPPVLNPEVVIEGERITAVGPTGAIPIPRGATVIDLSGHTILPGLFDCHVHLGGIPGDGGDTQKMRETVAHEAIYAVAHAKITLEKGFTSVRNIGAGQLPRRRAPRHGGPGHRPGAADPGGHLGSGLDGRPRGHQRLEPGRPDPRLRDDRGRGG